MVIVVISTLLPGHVSGWVFTALHTNRRVTWRCILIKSSGCSISRPRPSFQVPNALNAVMCVSNYRHLPPWLMCSLLSHIFLSSLSSAPLSTDRWSLHCEELPHIPTVMTSVETGEAVCKSPVVLLEDFAIKWRLCVVGRSAPCCSSHAIAVMPASRWVGHMWKDLTLVPKPFQRPLYSL